MVPLLFRAFLPTLKVQAHLTHQNLDCQIRRVASPSKDLAAPTKGVQGMEAYSALWPWPQHSYTLHRLQSCNSVLVVWSLLMMLKPIQSNCNPHIRPAQLSITIPETGYICRQVYSYMDAVHNNSIYRARNLKEYRWMKLPSFHFGVLTFK